ncbi:hypothetical protein J6590_028337 [Homalodisca vitripennis]|nr:hypothetical protein J6590_028337 [Homalodisca vitripennis]
MILSHQLPVNFAATTAFHLLHKHARVCDTFTVSQHDTISPATGQLRSYNCIPSATQTCTSNMILSHQLPVNFAATTAFHLLHKHARVCDTFTVSQHDTISPATGQLRSYNRIPSATQTCTCM